MSFDIIEVSNEWGRLIQLYEFQLGTTIWRYCTGPVDRIAGGHRYTSCPISDDGIKQKGDASSDTMNVTVPSDIGVAQVFIGTPPSAPMYLRIKRTHEGDNQVLMAYAGEITQVNFPTPGMAKMVVLPLSATMNREGLRLGWQRTCPYALYDPMTCRVNKADFATDAVIISAQGDVVQALAFGDLPNGRLDGGYLEWDHPVRGKEMRGIVEHVGDSVRMFGLADGLYYGLAVKAYPGCNLTSSACHNVFNNLNNYGGFPHMPGKSPFDGNPVF